MSYDRMKCHICCNYLHGVERCKYCHFEYDDDLPWTNPCEWDILDIDEDVEWSFLQIQYRLKSKDIDCLQVFNWFEGDAILITGIREIHPDRISHALGVHKECISLDADAGICVINLFMEKYLRGDLDGGE